MSAAIPPDTEPTLRGAPTPRGAPTSGAASPVAATVDQPVLQVTDLTVHYGQLRALSEVSLTVHAGEVFAIIGANGAGKSTLLRTLAGLHRPTSGTIRLDATEVTSESPESRLVDGIALVPEGQQIGLRHFDTS